MNKEDLQHAEGFRDRVSTVTEKGERKWVFALKPSGRFTNYRNYLNIFYLIIFFAMPFIKINGEPLFMLNFAEAKFVLFGKIFWPQDFFIFAVAAITAVIFIALFTVIYGRLFCGWVCPQTVFMEFVFRRIEWWIEGSPNQQRALNDGPWTGNKLFKKVLKHTIFLVISFFIANTFLSYIVGVDNLFKIISEPLSEHLALFTGLVVFTLLFYGVFAFVRDIVCTTICPYGRLQGVLFDKDTMQIAYDYSRGEPRGKLTKGQERTTGDCIDCKKCIHVCPTGIDIRNGVQMECVGCTACIDACDEVMDKVGFSRGLIRYASENEISGKGKFRFNNRMKAYTALLVVLLVFIGARISMIRSIDMYVKRVPGQLFQEVGQDSISNLFAAKIINKTRKEEHVELRMLEPQGSIKMIGQHALKPEAVNEVEFFVTIARKDIPKRSINIKLGVFREQENVQTVKFKFLGPFK